MPHILKQQLQHCQGLQAVMSCVISRALELTGTALGNVQLMNWNTGYLMIEEQRGFNDDFLSCFRLVNATDGSACARAIRERRPILIEDVALDREFAPYLAIAIGAGFCAVQSTPLISTSGAFVGVLSTHFPANHRLTDNEMRAMKLVGELAANAIIYQRTRQVKTNGIDAKDAEKRRVDRARSALQRSYALLERTGQRSRHI